MAEKVLGLFNTTSSASDAIAQLRRLGLADERVSIVSGVPYKTEILGRHHVRGRVGRFALLGALIGLLLAAFLTAGIFLLYPLDQGGQPIIPIPPSLIVFFEVTMLGTMWTTFFAFLIIAGLPRFRRQVYDPRLTEGYIGVVADADDRSVGQVEDALRNAGAKDVVRQEPGPPVDTGRRRFWGAVVAGLVLLTLITTLFVYDIIKIPFPTNMADQWSVAYDQGPRLAAPAGSIPLQGAALVAGQPATQPIPSSPTSLQRGKVMFGITCQICHGITGTGNGTLAGFFNPKPVDLTSPAIQNLSDQQLFVVITQGFGVMPQYHENMVINVRWDVVNYVRSLKK